MPDDGGTDPVVQNDSWPGEKGFGPSCEAFKGFDFGFIWGFSSTLPQRGGTSPGDATLFTGPKM